MSRLCQSGEDLLRDARIRCRFDLPPDFPARALTLEQRRSLLLVGREAFNNIVKHACATLVVVRVRVTEAELDLEIEDDGRGFDPATVRPGGLGLGSMRSRVDSLGGTFRIESAAGRGTRIAIRVQRDRPADKPKNNR